jgi:hypothetical protein
MHGDAVLKSSLTFNALKFAELLDHISTTVRPIVIKLRIDSPSSLSIGIFHIIGTAYTGTDS